MDLIFIWQQVFRLATPALCRVSVSGAQSLCHRGCPWLWANGPQLAEQMIFGASNCGFLLTYHDTLRQEPQTLSCITTPKRCVLSAFVSYSVRGCLRRALTNPSTRGLPFYVRDIARLSKHHSTVIVHVAGRQIPRYVSMYPSNS